MAFCQSFQGNLDYENGEGIVIEVDECTPSVLLECSWCKRIVGAGLVLGPRALVKKSGRDKPCLYRFNVIATKFKTGGTWKYPPASIAIFCSMPLIHLNALS
jgi:hypothetical protein